MKLKAAVIVTAFVLVGVAGALYFGGMLGSIAHMGPSSAQGAPKVYGTLTAVTPTSVTVTGQDGKPATFAINAQTQVVSQVAAGETGKTLEQMPLQSLVMVVPDASRTAALSVSLLPSLPPIPPAGAEIVIMEGAMRSKTPGSIALRLDDGSSVELLVTASTSVVSKVAAGSVGAGFDSLAFGDRVGAFGARKADGSVEALQLLILPASAAAGAVQ